MGVKHFYIWLKKNHMDCIDIQTNYHNKNIDNLCIDMNGVIHVCAQKVYQYGNNKPPKRFLIESKTKPKLTLKNQLKLFNEIGKTIDYIKSVVLPNKRIILCIDGVAGCAKLSQQRQRRFNGSKEFDKNEFDKNIITPGTSMMNHLSKYLDWFVKGKISHDPHWKDIEVVISNERVFGEGEHKIINYIRKYSSPCESFCIHGLDADLIMLGMTLNKNNIYILRENEFPRKELHMVDISKLKLNIEKMMKCDDTKSYKKNQGIQDFVFMCFMVGNDFLPTIPSLAILEGGIEGLIDVYKNIFNDYGHLTRNTRTINNMLNLDALEIFTGTIAQYEKGFLENKMTNKDKFIEDSLLEKYTTIIDGKTKVDMDGYKKGYYKKKFNIETEDEIKQICIEYMKGLNWIINYYKHGIPSWKWYYPYFYAPFLSDICKYVKQYKYKPETDITPLTPFEQLMCVLPECSHYLLPKTFSKILKPTYPDFYPTEFEVDCSGKRKEWEGIVLLPMVDIKKINEFYNKYKCRLSDKELSPNNVGKTFVYNFDDQYSKYIKSFYGDIKDCSVKLKSINL